ncbi:hypothetical protein [Paenibacillus sp. YAF4_2]|uniref:hypothetical protein n=1 Tax=Paenibacillus sp. YAF4_2 TaxID=3233085 RepID=UPI003F9C223D
MIGAYTLEIPDYTDGGLAKLAVAGEPVVLSTGGLESGAYVLYVVNPETGLVSEPEIIMLNSVPEDTSGPVLSGVTDVEFLSTETKDLKATSSEDGYLYLVQANVGVHGTPTVEELDDETTLSGIKVEVSANEEATLTVEAGTFIPGYYTFYAADEYGNVSSAAGTIIVR